MQLSGTIVAVSSPAGAGERAVVRLSGPRAIEIAERVFKNRDSHLFGEAEIGDCPCFSALAEAPTYTACDGRLAPPGTGLSVPATLYVMRGPKSYTREDVVEFHVGAWPAVVPVILEGLMATGARAAEPGEFTFRAFVGGRLDLSQAEAVMAVIEASNEAALRAAEGLLAGRLSEECSRLAEAIRNVLVLVEVDLNFSDQDIEPVPASQMAGRIEAVRRALADLGRRSRGLETFGGEVRLVLAGWPNVGKSSLFNRLLAAERAIVSPEAGTTRDELRAALHVGGLTLALSDVAGLQEARDELEGKVRAKAIEAIGRADLVLFVLDATADLYDRLDELLSLVAAPMVVAVAKCDLASADRARAYLAGRGVVAEVVATSAVTGEGVDALRAALVQAVEGGTVDREAAGPVVTARHRAALEKAAVALARAGRLARRDGAAGALVALELRESLESLETVVGRRADRDVLGAIFSRFCIGK